MVAVDCTDASESKDARDKFSLCVAFGLRVSILWVHMLHHARVFVPELDPAPADNAKASAELAIKAGDRLSGACNIVVTMVRCMPEPYCVNYGQHLPF